MTPEEILEKFIADFFLKKDPAFKENAINEMKQFARDMCDKQKQECIIAWANEPDETQEIVAITDAPYPKELQ